MNRIRTEIGIRRTAPIASAHAKAAIAVDKSRHKKKRNNVKFECQTHHSPGINFIKTVNGKLFLKIRARRETLTRSEHEETHEKQKERHEGAIGAKAELLQEPRWTRAESPGRWAIRHPLGGGPELSQPIQEYTIESQCTRTIAIRKTKGENMAKKIK